MGFAGWSKGLSQAQYRYVVLVLYVALSGLSYNAIWEEQQACSREEFTRIAEAHGAAV